MVRTTAEQVGKLVEIDSDLDVDEFIKLASSLVTEVCVPLGYDDDRLEIIERYLATHLYKLRDRETRLRTESIEGAITSSYDSKVDLGLSLTHEGQMAMFFDTKHGLATLNKQMTAKGSATTPTFFGLWHLGGD